MTESPDTLTTARRLEHDFGMDQRSSEGIAIAIHEHTTANVATKADLHLVRESLHLVEERLRGEMNELSVALRGEMNELSDALRGEMNELSAALRGEMKELEASLRGHTDSSVAGLRSEMHGEFKTLYRNLWLMFVGFAGVIVTLTKLLP
ncbi:MAG: hypothetical protein OXG44_13245 [Gammaproteobacteria bacterium]|nr:hypothetical protein [Gammaproteobacteria bacterium]